MVTCKICGHSFRSVTNSHLRKHGISTDEYAALYGAEFMSEETREAKRKHDIDWGRVPLGHAPDSVIATMLGVSRRRVCYARKLHNIPVFGGYLLTQEGLRCRSVYEAMYDAFLHWRGIAHQHEVNVPGLPFIADFLVDSCYVEIAGMLGFGRYRVKHQRKKQQYADNRISVKWLSADDVLRLYRDCPLGLQVDQSRVCKLCGQVNYELVDGYCRGSCYMKVYRASAPIAICQSCGKEYRAIEGSDRKFCSHACYAANLELNWPTWEQIEQELQTKSIRRLAQELGVKAPSLYMRIRRRKQRNNGLLV